MHDEPGKRTNYCENSMWKCSPMGDGFDSVYDPVAGKLVLRDTDGDASTPGPIDCIRTRGINVKQKWLGEVVHLSNIQTQTFEIIFRNINQVSLKTWVEKINEWAIAGGWFNELDLYGIKISNCRIGSVSLPTDESGLRNAIRGGVINLTVEQRICEDSAGTPFHSDLDTRTREVLPPCYQCTENGVGTGVFHKASGIDPQAAVVEKCYDECLASGNCTPAAGYQGALGPLIGAIQMDDASAGCVAQTNLVDGSAVVVEDALGVAGPVKDYKGLSAKFAAACSFIDDITEDFKFNYGKGNAIDFTHNVNIKLFDSCPKGVDPLHAINDTGGPGQAGDKAGFWAEGGNPGEYAGDDGNTADGFSICRPGQFNVDDALTMAREMLDLNIPNFGVAFSPGFLRILEDKNVIPYYTEAQNLITGEVSMSKRLTLYKHRDANFDWSSDYTHSLVVDQSGIAKVTEKGKIRGYKKKSTNVAGDGPADVVDNAYKNAQDGMEEVLGVDFTLAKDRIVKFWEEHRQFYKNYFSSPPDPNKPNLLAGGEVPVELKVEHPLEKTRNFNEITRECSYTITYTTSPNIFEEFMANRTLTASRGIFGSITLKEKSELTSYTPKGEDYESIPGTCSIAAHTNEADCVTNGGIWTPTVGTIDDHADDFTDQPAPDKVVDSPIELIFPRDYKGNMVGSFQVAGGTNPGAKGRAVDFYNGLLADTQDFSAPNPQACTDPVFGDTGLKLWSRNIEWSPSGRSMSYEIQFTTDKTVSCSYPDPHGIRQTQVSTSDKLPKRMFKEHAIANNRMLVHDPKQTRLGSRTVDLDILLERVPKHNMLENPLLPQVALHELADRAKTEILNVFNDYDYLIADDMMVTLCKYTFDSKWKATLTVSVQYLQKI